MRPAACHTSHRSVAVTIVHSRRSNLDGQGCVDFRFNLSVGRGYRVRQGEGSVCRGKGRGSGWAGVKFVSDKPAALPAGKIFCWRAVETVEDAIHGYVHGGEEEEEEEEGGGPVVRHPGARAPDGLPAGDPGPAA